MQYNPREKEHQRLTLWRGSWCSLHGQRSSCSHSRALGCRGSYQNCVPVRGPKSRLHPVGSQSDPTVGEKKWGTKNMRTLYIYVPVYCKFNQSYLSELWAKTKPNWSAQKRGEKKRRKKMQSSKKAIFKLQIPKTVQKLSELPPSSFLYYSVSSWRPEFICHSITPADPIIPAASGNSYCRKLHKPTAVWLATALISETTAPHKPDRDGERRERGGRWRFHLVL